MFSDDEETDEFFDCRETMDDSSSLAKWSSMDLLPLDGSGEIDSSRNQGMNEQSMMRAQSLQQSMKLRTNIEPEISVRRVHSLHMSSNTSPIPHQEKPPSSAAPHFMFSKPSQDLPDVDEGGR